MMSSLDGVSFLRLFSANSAATTEEFILQWILAFLPMRQKDFNPDLLGSLLVVTQYILFIHSSDLEENSLLTLFTLVQVAFPVFLFISLSAITTLGLARLLDERNSINYFRLFTILGYYFLPLLIAHIFSSYALWLSTAIKISGTASLAQSLMTLPRDSTNGAILGCCVSAVAWKLLTLLPS